MSFVTPSIYWIPAFAGMTKNTVFRLFTDLSLLTRKKL
jgi:hypothetical protein